MVEIAVVTRPRWEVLSVRWRSVCTMYITSSTAEVMKGALEVVETGELRESVRSEGASSSWKAFSTERRQKNVVIAEKGSSRRDSTFWARREFWRRGGSVNGIATSASVEGSG